MEILIFWALCGILTALIATRKNRAADIWALAGIFFGPIALIILALLPRIEPTDAQRMRAENLKKCPDCAELVRAEAIKCRHCGRYFDQGQAREATITDQMADRIADKLTRG